MHCALLIILVEIVRVTILSVGVGSEMAADFDTNGFYETDV